MSYAQLYYHLVWSTRREEPLLTARIEPPSTTPSAESSRVGRRRSPLNGTTTTRGRRHPAPGWRWPPSWPSSRRRRRPIQPPLSGRPCSGPREYGVMTSTASASHVMTYVGTIKRSIMRPGRSSHPGAHQRPACQTPSPCAKWHDYFVEDEAGMVGSIIDGSD